MVQWLRICFAVQGTQVQTLAGKVRSHLLWSLRATIRGACMPQQKIPYDATKVPWAATKTQHSQINKFFFKY